MVQELHARYTKLQTGSVYHNLGGSDYVCLKAGETIAYLMNVYSGRKLIVMEVVQYENGWIEWSWSKELLADFEQSRQTPERG